MIFSLRRGKLEPAQASRLRYSRAQPPQGRLERADQGFTSLTNLLIVSARSFKVLFGGILLLLVSELIHRHTFSSILAGIMIAHLAWKATTVQRLGRLRTTPAEHERARRADRSSERRDRRPAIEWQQISSSIGDCSTIQALERLATERATEIADAPAMVEIASARTSAAEGQERVFRAAIHGGGWLTVFAVQQELGLSQRSALEQLALLVGLQAERLRGATRLARQQDGLIALWEVSGVLRSALNAQQAVREACARVASALGLNWLALLAPDDRQSLAAVLIARGGGRAAPRLTGAQMRVAAEALRTEHALVRSEGDQAFTCLPVWFSGGSPVVLVAHGENMDAAMQTLLMLLGEMIVDRLARYATSDCHIAGAAGLTLARAWAVHQEDSDWLARSEAGRDISGLVAGVQCALGEAC